MPIKKPTKKREAPTTTAERPVEAEAGALARTMLQPTVQAAATLQQYEKAFREVNPLDLIEALTEQTRATSRGDLKRAEAMLTAQAHTLDAIYNHLARRAENAQYVDHLGSYLKLALRAQSQCRATWETLNTIKNPPVMGYVRQANITSGPQQVNNTLAVPAPAAEEIPNLQTKQLEEKDDQRLDFGTSRTAGRVDSAMAAVGEVDRTKEPGR